MKSLLTKFNAKSEQSRAEGDFGDLTTGNLEIPITHSVFSG